MSASAAKKVIVERFERSPLRGFVQLNSFLTADGLEILSPEGAVTVVGLDQVKAVSFVRDLDGKGVLGERREFLARPKIAGLWVELSFRDGDRLEAVVPSNLQLIEAAGYTVTPPEATGNAQRVFVPKSALVEASVLGVVGGKKLKPKEPQTQQITLFPVE